MSNNFTTKQYRDPSESLRQDETELLAGLKFAQSEIASSEDETKKDIEPLIEKDGTFAGWFRRHSKKIESEKSRLEGIKRLFEQSLTQINERMEKIRELQDALEKTNKNMDVLSAQISSFEKADIRVLRQLAQELQAFPPYGGQNTNE